jgi:hypothetical protein
MTEIASYEHHFITNDGPTFKMIEDESGDIWWGYGHREAEEFTGEVNRWLMHACGVTDPDDLFPANQTVEHLWATLDDEDGEHFTLVDAPEAAFAGPEVFPITRLMI